MFLARDLKRQYYLKCMIIGPADTPYEVRAVPVRGQPVPVEREHKSQRAESENGNQIVNTISQ